MVLISRMFSLIVFVVVVVLPYRDCQICTERVAMLRWVPETYHQTQRQSYWGQCYYPCKRYRTTSYLASRVVQRNVVEIKKKCCQGYLEVDDYSSDELVCEPICNPSCKSGFCISPGQCACYDGYKLVDHTCMPICNNSCDHGSCVAPNNCKCDFGYTWNNHTCQPVCTEPCIANATCAAPDSCQCLDGYRETENNLCLPYCTRGCLRGTCVSPENCICHLGWRKKSDSECLPVCDTNCGEGGTCISPNLCECKIGYKLENGTCLPECFNGCLHGTCVAPNNCTCDAGWVKDGIDGVCLPVCDLECGKGGSCISPNICKCDPKYTKAENGQCEPYCSNGCPNGTCISPEVCECKKGWIKQEFGNCVPSCNKPCGNGSCIAPDQCQCHNGFKIDVDNMFDFFNESICVPECKNCNGSCIAPNNCICEIPYEAKSVEAVGGDCECTVNCSESNRRCNYTVCVLREDLSTTSSPSIISSTAHQHSIFFGDNDGLSTDVSVDDSNRLNISNDTEIYGENSSLRNNAKQYWSQYWIYIVMTIVITTVIAISVLFVKRKALSHFFNGGTYPVEDEKSMDLSCSIETNVTYSNILEKGNDCA